MSYTTEQLNNVFSNLPPKYQGFIMDQNNRLAVEKIITNHKITSESRFKEELFAVLVGLETLDEFTTHIYSMLAVPNDEEVNDILVELSTAVLDSANEFITYYNAHPESFVDDKNPAQTPTPIQPIKPVVPVTPLTPPISTPQPSLVNSRLNQVTSMPQQTVSVTPAPVAATTPTPTPTPAPTSTPKPATYTGADPYREAPTP